MMTRHFMKKSSLIDSPIERESFWIYITEARQHLGMSHCMQTKPLAKCMRQCLASGTFGWCHGCMRNFPGVYRFGWMIFIMKRKYRNTLHPIWSTVTSLLYTYGCWFVNDIKYTSLCVEWSRMLKTGQQYVACVSPVWEVRHYMRMAELALTARNLPEDRFHAADISLYLGPKHQRWHIPMPGMV